MNKELKDFLEKFEKKAIPAYKEYILAYFNATISGKKEDYDKSSELQINYNKIFSNKEDFSLLKKIKESNSITDDLLKRQLDVLYRTFSKNQIDEKKLEEIIKLSTDIENRFSTFRAEVGGKKLTDNEIEEILKNSTNSEQLRETWIASKKIGAVVADDIKKLVKLRNQTAQQLGYSNYHEMSLILAEQNPAEIEKILMNCLNLQKKFFLKLKMKWTTFSPKGTVSPAIN